MMPMTLCVVEFDIWWYLEEATILRSIWQCDIVHVTNSFMIVFTNFCSYVCFMVMKINLNLRIGDERSHKWFSLWFMIKYLMIAKTTHYVLYLYSEQWISFVLFFHFMILVTMNLYNFWNLYYKFVTKNFDIIVKKQT